MAIPLHNTLRLGAALVAALALVVCSSPPEHPPGTHDSGHAADAGHPDSDAGHEIDPYEDAGQPLTGPERLSETGLYADFAARSLAPGVFEFTPRFELWSDGAEKRRYLQLPEGARIDTSKPDGWVFPVGTKSWKEFRKDGKPVETRLLWKKEPGARGWFQMAYVWNADETEAFAAPEGEVDARGTEHDVPAQRACGTCHGGVDDVLIGPSAVQLGGPDGALSAWAAEGRFTHPPAGPYTVPGEPKVQAVLGYFHGNCGHCHGEGNALATKRELRMRLTTADTTVEGTGTYRTTLNQKAWHVMEDGTSIIVVPGDPARSQLFSRIQLRDASSADAADGYQMPPTCSEKVDAAGVAAVRAWIEGL